MNHVHSSMSSHKLAIFDIDGFTMINKVHGSSVGELVLEKVQEFLLSTRHDSERAYKWGADEFFVIVKETTEVSIQNRI